MLRREAPLPVGHLPEPFRNGGCFLTGELRLGRTRHAPGTCAARVPGVRAVARRGCRARRVDLLAVLGLEGRGLRGLVRLDGLKLIFDSPLLSLQPLDLPAQRGVLCAQHRVLFGRATGVGRSGPWADTPGPTRRRRRAPRKRRREAGRTAARALERSRSVWQPASPRRGSRERLDRRRGRTVERVTLGDPKPAAQGRDGHGEADGRAVRRP